MDTAIIITGIIGLGAGVTLGAVYWSSIITAQKDEIAAMQDRNFELRHELGKAATLAHTAGAEAHGAIEAGKITERHLQMAESMLAAEIDSHHATKRRLSAAKGQITKLRNARRG